MDDSPEDDALLKRLLDGDEDAFRQVYRTTHPGLLRYLTVLVGPVDADDVAAEAWTQAFRDLGTFAGTLDGFRGWVTTIGRHRALDLVRSRQRRPVVDVPDEELLDHALAPAAEADALTLVTTAEALRLIATLPPDQAEAVLLRAVVGLDAKTAGAVLGKRPGAVRTAAYRGLRTLQRRILPGDSDVSGVPDADEVR
ncbi:RNA polymerase sigma factor [Marmoricola sp. RAF53]|uniref:RNA polymerase sigma factor n=1 Tax=Marmoricola sp. RAF53 TaxID=3233059 RepID=UPI003F98D021